MLSFSRFFPFLRGAFDGAVLSVSAPTVLDAVAAGSVRTKARYRATALGVVLTAVLLLTACGQQQASSGRGGGAPGHPGAARGVPEVGVIVLQTQAQQMHTRLAGRVSAVHSAEVRPQVSGIIQKRLFTEGAQVQAGQVLYQIDPALLLAAHAGAQAGLAKAQSNLQRLERTARRNAQLMDIAAISRQAFEDGEAAVQQARAELAAAQAAVRTASVQLRYSRVVAPIAGQVGLSAVSQGALVTANQAAALTTIVQTDPVYVDVTQTTAELLQLRRDHAAGRYQQPVADATTQGTTMADAGKAASASHRSNTPALPVRIVLEDGSEHPHMGRLQFAGMVVNPGMGTVTLRAQVPNPQGDLLPGMYVQAIIPTGVADQALLLPQQAVRRDLTGRASVFVVDANDTVQQRHVQLGQAVGHFWLLQNEGGSAGTASDRTQAAADAQPVPPSASPARAPAGEQRSVQAGDRVIVDGLQKVRPGTKVRPVVVEASTAARPGVDAQAAAAALRAAQGR